MTHIFQRGGPTTNQMKVPHLSSILDWDVPIETLSQARLGIPKSSRQRHVDLDRYPNNVTYGEAPFFLRPPLEHHDDGIISRVSATTQRTWKSGLGCAESVSVWRSRT